MEFAQPPAPADFSLPPPSSNPSNGSIPSQLSMPPPQHQQHQGHHHGGGGGRGHHHHYGGHHYHGHGAGKPGHPYFKNFSKFGSGGMLMTQDDFDGKRLRKSVMRKTVDYNAAIVKALNARVWQRDVRDRHALQPESIYIPDFLPPSSYLDNPSNAITTKFVKTATNKMRCPIFTLAWTPEGRRLVTGASSGEFTLWNGLTFNFETILQAHDVPVRTMIWSHNDSWMVTGDHGGYVKYWQSNMNNVKMFQAHKEPIRGISFSPNDSKFASCSDDGTVRVWDFLRYQEERVLRGHGADVKCVHWHPQKALIVSGSKDNQQPIKLWDPKSGQALATLHAHKSTVMDLKWNDNGNWLITASRDHLLKLFDLRNLREEVQIFRGHKKEASSVSWHPIHEGLFSSGGSDGSILFWNVGTDKEIGSIDTAHDSIVWTLAWHPLGHILCSGSNDHTIKFWTRNRPGDLMRDKYNLNTLPPSLAGLDECDLDDNTIIPGMGPEDKVEFTESLTADKGFIPGLELDTNNLGDDKKQDKKVPYSKPIPRNFQAQWNDTGRGDETEDNSAKEIKEAISQLAEKAPSINAIPTAILVYGKLVPIMSASNLQTAVMAGPDALNRYISSGEIEELNDLLPKECKPDPEKLKSPPVKKSRFNDAAPIYDHKAKLIYGNDTDLRHQTILQKQQQQQQNTVNTNQTSNMMNQNNMTLNQNQSNHNQMTGNFNMQQNQGSQQQPAIPSLLAIKLPQPDEFRNSPIQDEDFRRFNNYDDDNSQWSQNGSNNFNDNFNDRNRKNHRNGGNNNTRNRNRRRF